MRCLIRSAVLLAVAVLALPIPILADDAEGEAFEHVDALKRDVKDPALLAAKTPDVADGQEEGEPREAPNLDRLREMLEEEKEEEGKEESPVKKTHSQEQAPSAPTLEQRVDKAIQNGVQWLDNNQLDNGGWGDGF